VLADAGYQLVVFSRRPVSGEPFTHPNITVNVGSLDDPNFIDTFLTTALQRSKKLRGAIFLNGGYESDQGIGSDEFTQVLQQMMEKNVYPTTKVLSRILPYWQQHGGGKVVLTSATAVQHRFAKGGAYATSKMAVDSLARQIQREYDPEDVDVHVL